MSIESDRETHFDLERRKNVEDLKISVAILAERVDRLIESNKTQDSQLDKLVELANKGKGSWWILTVIGAIVGFILANLKHIVRFFGD